MRASAGAAVTMAAPFIPATGGFDLRDWWLLLVLPLAYWTPAPLAGSPNLRLEHWLLTVDRRLGFATAHVPQRPVLEAAYLLVSPMVPAGLLAVIVSGGNASLREFWLSLLAAVLPCYGLLPVLPTRPPRALLVPPAGAPSTPSPIRHVNVRFLAAFGIGWNTLPSGHAAAAAAVAVLVWRSGSPLWPVFAVLAAGIALATVRGRYHYAIDTVLGIALGLAASM